MSIQQQQITKHTNKQLHNISVFIIVKFITKKPSNFLKYYSVKCTKEVKGTTKTVVEPEVQLGS